MRCVYPNNTNTTIKNGLRAAMAVCHSEASTAGWWLKDRNRGELIALIHSELSEALEGYRKDSMDDHLPHRKSREVELADTLIRIFDLAAADNLDLAGALLEKLEYNATREDHSLEHRARPDGKKF